ncbi:MAG: bifunctional hydroxymethylpyrimidine kinase/phosphomethylpyrimidine kinase [Deltaproteobacteria bacterium]|nr:bifunctional hydroxymethylpyrimidine kinase/phosphomethylpyrimidine kinase [Deltaproteobacteria bacterium]
MEPILLSVAGVDPSAGAGLLADLETFRSHGARGVGVVSLVTVQSSRGVKRVEVMQAELVRDQLRALLEDLPIAAIKTGALGDAAVVRAVAQALADFRGPVVVDPVVCSSSGASLLDDAGVDALLESLLPRATLIMPNLAEAQLLTGLEVCDLASMGEAAAVLRRRGVERVLVKGGHLAGAPTDLWLDAAGSMQLTGERVATRHTHGTGCAYASAISARLGWGEEPRVAARSARRWLEAALRSAPGLGAGEGPLELRTQASPIRSR